MTAGAFAARVAELQVILVPVSAATLGIAHYLAYWRGGPGRRRQRIVLWIGTVLSITFWVVPAMVR